MILKLFNHQDLGHSETRFVEQEKDNKADGLFDARRTRMEAILEGKHDPYASLDTLDFTLQESKNSQMGFYNLSINLHKEGNFHISGIAKVWIDRGNSPGTVSGNATYTFFGYDGSLLFQINQPFWLDSGVNPMDGTIKYPEVKQYFSQVSTGRFSFSSEIKIRKHPNPGLQWPKWPWER